MSSLAVTHRDLKSLSLQVPTEASAERGYISYGSGDDDYHPLFALSPINKCDKPVFTFTKPLWSLHVRSDSTDSNRTVSSHTTPSELDFKCNDPDEKTFPEDIDGYRTSIENDDDDADTVISSLSSIISPKRVRSGSFDIDVPAVDNDRVHSATRESTPVAASTRRGISERLISIVSAFWTQHIQPLTGDDRLEIAVSMLYGMRKDAQCRRVIHAQCRTSREMEKLGLKLLDDMAWTVRMVSRNLEFLDEALRAKGSANEGSHFYSVMTQQLDETLCFYFTTEYTAEVRFAVDALFAWAAQMRTGKEITLSLRGINGGLNSVAQCVRGAATCEALMRYLVRREHDEIALFLRLLLEFKRAADGHQRMRVAADLNGLCLDPESSFFIGEYVSASLREQFRREMSSDALGGTMMDGAYFEEIEAEIYDFVMRNLWDEFIENL